MKTLTLGSLFDGIGGFTLAAQRCGIKTVWASEIEPSCIEITKRHFHNVMHLGDITKIRGGDIPPVDIISFGSPCQDLSSAGKQAGIDGERSGLFRDAIRIVYEMRLKTNGRYPTFIIWENVRGALGSNGGRDFRAVLEAITNADIPMPSSGRWASAGMAGGCRGGASIAWRQMDAQYWGVPQRRKRIFLVGDFRAERAPEILFECENLCGYIAKSGKEKETPADSIIRNIEIAGGIDGGGVVDFGRISDRIFINAEIARTITASNGGGGSKTGNYLLRESIGEENEPQEDNKYKAFAVYPMRDPQLNQNPNGFIVSAEGSPAPTISKTDRHAIAACYARSSHGGYSAETKIAETLCASAGKKAHNDNLAIVFNNIKFSIRYALRRLTPLECERLQGFPDHWTKYNALRKRIADTPRYIALGNSLAVPCAERVFRGIIKVIGG